VAKVGQFTLTQEQVENSADAEDYINNWIDNHLLALEAQKLKLNEYPDYKKQLEDIQTQLLADRLLTAKCDSLEPPSEKEISDFYNSHRNEFLRMESEVDFAYFSGSDVQVLTEIANSLKAGAEEKELAAQHPELNLGWDRLYDPVTMPAPYNQFADYKAGQITSPLLLNDKYYVFKINAVRAPGTLKSLVEVRDLIIERITGDERSRMREILLKSLRTKYHPELNIRLLRNSGLISGEK
jgi:hypothetical protein